MLAYHGTTRSFDTFDPTAAIASGSITAHWGTFFSASQTIAAHFTLKPDVVDEGYDSEEGSRSLVRDPWQFNTDPFQPNAQVVAVDLTLHHPKVMDAIAWMALVEDLHGDLDPLPRVQALRAAWVAEGHDGLLILAWDGHSTDADGVKPSVETDADTYVVFEAQAVRIQHRQRAEACWEEARPCPEPTARRRRWR